MAEPTILTFDGCQKCLRLNFEMIGRVFIRRMTSLAQPLPKTSAGQYPVPNSPKYRKLQALQTRFCLDDGLLVWQKQSSDMLLYRISILLVLTGTLMTANSLRKLCAPPKND